MSEKIRKSPAARGSPSESSTRRKLVFEEPDEQEVPGSRDELTDFTIEQVENDEDVIMVEEEIIIIDDDNNQSDRVKLLENKVETLENKIAVLEKSLRESQEREKELAMKINSAELPIIYIIIIIIINLFQVD